MEEWEPHEQARLDAALLDRFAAAYSGGGRVVDVLWWLSHPGLTAPSGAASPEVALERLRRAVYAPGAGPRDREAYLAAEAAWRHRQESARSAWVLVRPTPEPEPEPEPPEVGSDDSAEAAQPQVVGRDRAVVGRRVALGAGLALVVGGAVALQRSLGGSSTAGASVAVVAVPTPLMGAMGAMQARAFRDPQSYAAVAAVESIARHTDVASPRARRLLAASSSAQGAGVSLSGARVAVNGSFRYVHDLESGSRLFVQVLTAHAATWRWMVVGVSPSWVEPHVVAVVRGDRAAGRLQEAVLRLPPGVTPVRFEIVADGRTPFRWRSITDGSSRAAA